LTNIF